MNFGCESCNAFDRFQAAERNVRPSGNRGHGDGKQRNMCDGVEVCSGISVANPKPFLPRRFETGVVAFALASQGINRLEFSGFAIDGKPAIIGDCDIFGAAAVFPAVVPVFVIAGAASGF